MPIVAQNIDRHRCGQCRGRSIPLAAVDAARFDGLCLTRPSRKLNYREADDEKSAQLLMRPWPFRGSLIFGCRRHWVPPALPALGDCRKL